MGFNLAFKGLMELIYTTDITMTCYIGIYLHNTEE
jgi:hypothetical protein